MLPGVQTKQLDLFSLGFRVEVGVRTKQLDLFSLGFGV